METCPYKHNVIPATVYKWDIASDSYTSSFSRQISTGFLTGSTNWGGIAHGTGTSVTENGWLQYIITTTPPPVIFNTEVQSKVKSATLYTMWIVFGLDTDGSSLQKFILFKDKLTKNGTTTTGDGTHDTWVSTKNITDSR